MCVAVTVSLSACASPFNLGAPEPKPEPSVTPTETPAPPAESGDYDEWEYSIAEPKAEAPAEYEESLRLLSEELDLGVTFQQPSKEYSDLGWTGVAKYGKQCIITFGINEQSATDHSVEVLVMSRFDGSLTVMINWSSDYEAIRTNLEPLKKWCTDGGPLPYSTEDGGEVPQQEPPTIA